MTDFLGFWFRVILSLYGITFHPAVVLGPEHDFLFKSASTYCALEGILRGDPFPFFNANAKHSVINHKTCD